MNDQHLKEQHIRQRQQTNNQRGQTRNGTPSSDPSLIRRHTTPDMAASAAYGMGKNFLKNFKIYENLVFL